MVTIYLRVYALQIIVISINIGFSSTYNIGRTCYYLYMAAMLSYVHLVCGKNYMEQYLLWAVNYTHFSFLFCF